MDSGERGMNPVAMTIINPQKEYWSRLFVSLPHYRLSYGARFEKHEGFDHMSTLSLEIEELKILSLNFLLYTYFLSSGSIPQYVTAATG